MPTATAPVRNASQDLLSRLRSTAEKLIVLERLAVHREAQFGHRSPAHRQAMLQVERHAFTFEVLCDLDPTGVIRDDARDYLLTLRTEPVIEQMRSVVATRRARTRPAPVVTCIHGFAAPCRGARCAS